MRNRFQYRAALTNLLLLIFAATASHAQLQTYTITGTIRNTTNKEVVPAVSITVKGTNTTTTTDANGRFTINAPQGSTLVVSSVGFRGREITVAGTESE